MRVLRSSARSGGKKFCSEGLMLDECFIKITNMRKFVKKYLQNV
jgi:hypothetical protein